MAARLTAYIVSSIVTLTLVAGLIVRAQREGEGPVDLMVVNGRVFTADGSGELAEAVAVQGNRIVRVGRNREVLRLRRPQTEVIDAGGGAVLPGLNDAHVHLLSGGLALHQVALHDARTAEAALAEVRAWAEANPESEWVRGRGWYYDAFGGGLPTRQMIDRVVPDRPVYLVSYDGHTAWVNSLALARAGVTRRTPDPPGGTIQRDPRTGEPTGVLKETAMRLVAGAIPPPSRDEQLGALREAIREAHRHGITSIQNAGGTPEELDLYDELRRSGELTLRVYQALTVGPESAEDDLTRLEYARERFPDDPVLKTGAVKIVLDGVVETHTAAMLAPYADRPDTAGEPRFSQERLDALVAELDARGWQVLIHAIGDRAVRMALDAFAHAAARNPAPPRGRRHRIEHLETIDPDDVARFAELGVVASFQPYHAIPPAEGRDQWSLAVGPERAARGWMMGSLHRAGARLVFGSDWPVMTIDPRLGVHVAVTRTRPEGEPPGGSHPGERLPLAAALEAYTREAAWAAFDDQRKGVVAPNMLADLVILSADIFETGDILDAVVEVTIVNGRVVYRRAEDATDD